MIRLSIPVFLAGMFAGIAAHAQTDTVRLSLADAEQRFLQANGRLLAARLNVEAARAAEIQASLWPNPTISVEQNVYNQFTNRWFDLGAEGNSGVTLSQLILLAGKRGKAVRVAESNTRMAEQNLYDLLRSLKLELRSDFHDLTYLRRSLTFYNGSIEALTRAADHLETAYAQRAVLLSEVLRVRELLFSLQNERLGILARITTAENDIHVLLNAPPGTHSVVIPIGDPVIPDTARAAIPSRDEAIAQALAHRPDLVRAEEALTGDEATVAYQRSLAVPDLTVGGMWSRAGSYIPNYIAMTLSIDLPVFNRNQGNIALAERMFEADRATLESARLDVIRDVTVAWQRVKDIIALQHESDPGTPAQFRALADGMYADYQRRNISVLEFTDFLESYRTSLVLQNQLENDRADAIEALNFAAGTDIVKP